MRAAVKIEIFSGVAERTTLLCQFKHFSTPLAPLDILPYSRKCYEELSPIPSSPQPSLSGFFYYKNCSTRISHSPFLDRHTFKKNVNRGGIFSRIFIKFIKFPICPSFSRAYTHTAHFFHPLFAKMPITMRTTSKKKNFRMFCEQQRKNSQSEKNPPSDESSGGRRVALQTQSWELSCGRARERKFPFLRAAQ